MKRSVIFLMLLVLGNFIYSQTNSETANIIFDETTHDYGTIDQGANGEFDFVFTNIGKLPLILTNVSSSCGCTIPIWPKEPILPGKTGSIKVKYDTKRVGVFTKTITVTSNAKNPPVLLTIKGNVLSKSN